MVRFQARGVGDLGDESGASSLPTGPEFTAPPPDGISWSAVISRPPRGAYIPPRNANVSQQRPPTTALNLFGCPNPMKPGEAGSEARTTHTADKDEVQIVTALLE